MTLKFRVLFSLFMSLVLSSLMTLWVTWINLGFAPDFLTKWGIAFLLAWPAAGTISFLFSPGIQNLTRHAVHFWETTKPVEKP